MIEKRGYDIVVIDQLPSIGADPEALGDLHADAAYVRDVVDAVDGPVCLVGHSYGGMVITELADHPAVRHSIGGRRGRGVVRWSDRIHHSVDLWSLPLHHTEPAPNTTLVGRGQSLEPQPTGRVRTRCG